MVPIWHGEDEGDSMAPVPILLSNLSLYSRWETISYFLATLSYQQQEQPLQSGTHQRSPLPPLRTMQIEALSGVANERGASLNILLRGPNLLDANLKIIFILKV